MNSFPKALGRWAPWALAGTTTSALIFIVLGDVDWAAALPSARDNVVFVTALVGIASLIFATVTSAKGRVSAQKQATLEAVNSWVSESREHRALITEVLGLAPLSEEQGQALATPGVVLLDRHGHQLNLEQKRQVLNAILDTLNGLETIAVGVHHGLYRTDVIQPMAGTICRLTYDRFRTFVERHRVSGPVGRQQHNAFRSLELMVRAMRE